MTVGELLELAQGYLESGEERVDKVYGWRHERGLARAREAFAAFAVILTPLLAAIFDPEAEVPPLVAGAYAVAAIAAFVGGLQWLNNLRALDGEYFKAIRLYGLLRRAIEGR